MALPILGHIAAAEGLGAPAQFAWDDKFPARNYTRDDTKLENHVADVTRRGIVALTAGCAEWVVARFRGLSQDPVPDQFIEAVWAGIVDWRHLRLDNRPEAGRDAGPIRGPLYAMIRILHKSAQQASLLKPNAYETVCMSNLAQLVLPEPGPFKKWRDGALKRLVQFYPRSEVDPLGPPLPREILDLTLDYKPENDDELIARFLTGLDPSRNPFLRPQSEWKDLETESA
jgi:hypothetical protein